MGVRLCVYVSVFVSIYVRTFVGSDSPLTLKLAVYSKDSINFEKIYCSTTNFVIFAKIFWKIADKRKPLAYFISKH